MTRNSVLFRGHHDPTVLAPAPTQPPLTTGHKPMCWVAFIQY